MLENFINIIGWLIVCLLSLGILWVLIWSVLMVIGYRMYKQHMRKFREQERKDEEWRDEVFRKARK